jgi:hypothetical protein
MSNNTTNAKTHKNVIWGISIALLIVSAITLCSLALAIGGERFLLGEYIYSTEHLGKAILEYAERTGKWPDADKWCDEIDIEDIMSWRLIYEDNKPQCNFAMNKYAIGLAKDIPDDMVLLFESEFGWNKVGGAEIAKERIPGIIQVVFGNGDTKAIPEKDINQLRWQVNQQASLSYDPEPWFTLIFVSVIIIALGIVATLRKQLRDHWILTICIAIGATGVSFILGGFSTVLYHLGTSDNPSLVFVITPGFLLGAGFVPVLGEIRTGLDSGQSFICRGVLTGAITGIIGSTIVHVLMMIHYQDSHFIKPLAGAGFGIIAGMILGWITATIMQIHYKKQVCCNTPTEMESNEINELS